MLMILGSPTFPRKLVTTSSNLSWPTSMQSVCLIVLTRILLSVSFAAASSGTRGFSIRLAAGVLWTGTRKCISTFAAAEDEIGFTGAPSRRGAARPSNPGRITLFSGAGITIDSPQEGQLISEPAPELSTASSWSHLGQLKITSISGPLVGYTARY